MKTDFNEIQFNAQYHTYTIQGKRLRNVTSLVSKFKQPFDRDYWAAKKANEQGATPEEIIAKWEAKGQASRDLGTRVHELIETRLYGLVIADPILQMNMLPAEYNSFSQFWDRTKGSLKPYQIEWRVGDVELNLAGTVDCVMYSKTTGQYHLFDWKTGKLDKTNDYGKMMLPPVDHLENCKLNHYSLQLSAYRLILERNTDLLIGDSYIVHLEPSRWEIIRTYDYRELIPTILDA